MKAALIQYASPGMHADMLRMTEAAHRRYCTRFGADFLTFSGSWSSPWQKVNLLDDLLPHYDRLLWLDADTVILRQDFDLFSLCPFGIGVCDVFDHPRKARHLNTGVVFVARSPDVVAFMAQWAAEQGKPEWRHDQDAFNALMRARPPRDLLVILPNRFNCVPLLMDARDPFIRAFHGDPERVRKVRETVDKL